jgi:hypothetical protein
MHKTQIRYAVETAMTYGWENVWQEDDSPMTFATLDEAEAELVQFFKDAEHMGYSSEDYRIVQVIA